MYFAEFDNFRGARIVSQFPNNPEIITQEAFSSVSDLVISAYDMSHRHISILLNDEFRVRSLVFLWGLEDQRGYPK